MNATFKFAFLLLTGLFVSGCSTTKTTETATQTPASQAKVHVTCINQYFSNDAESLAKEKKFVIIPYRELKPPKDDAKQKPDNDEANFDRVAKMEEKVLIDAGLKPTKKIDENTLVIGLKWSTKDKTNYLTLKAMDHEKKETRWQLKADGESTDTFYLNVLPLLMAAGSKHIGKNCDKPVYEMVDDNSPEVQKLKNYQRR